MSQVMESTNRMKIPLQKWWRGCRLRVERIEQAKDRKIGKKKNPNFTCFYYCRYKILSLSMSLSDDLWRQWTNILYIYNLSLAGGSDGKESA